jgi:hypothetical protein
LNWIASYASLLRNDKEEGNRFVPLNDGDDGIISSQKTALLRNDTGRPDCFVLNNRSPQ